MAPQKNKHKKRLTAHTALMIFTLFALACSMVAWFTNSKTAQISQMQMNVDNKNLVLTSTISNIQFLTTTKIADTTKTLFNAANTGCVVKTYTLQGAVDVVATVECTGAGMLAYVCYDDEHSSTTDYYTKITTRLQTELGTDMTKWTYSGIQTALKKINNHEIQKRDSSGNTTVKIVYWVEYDQATSFVSDSYWGPSNGTYKATITFVA